MRTMVGIFIDNSHTIIKWVFETVLDLPRHPLKCSSNSQEWTHTRFHLFGYKGRSPRQLASRGSSLTSGGDGIVLVTSLPTHRIGKIKGR